MPINGRPIGQIMDDRRTEVINGNSPIDPTKKMHKKIVFPSGSLWHQPPKMAIRRLPGDWPVAALDLRIGKLGTVERRAEPKESLDHQISLHQRRNLIGSQQL